MGGLRDREKKKHLDTSKTLNFLSASLPQKYGVLMVCSAVDASVCAVKERERIKNKIKKKQDVSSQSLCAVSDLAFTFARLEC